MSVPILIVPGLGGSGPDHWQSLWQSRLPDARCVEQANWDDPTPKEWLAALANAIERTPGAVIVAHSLGCILVAHLVSAGAVSSVTGALLVAPADVERDAPAPECIRRFAPVPLVRMPFASIVVASGNDPFAARGRTALFARHWEAELVDIGDAGHINVESGFGPWPEGLTLLERLTRRATDG